MRNVETLKIRMHPQDYEIFTNYLNRKLKGQQCINRDGGLQKISVNYGVYVTLAIKHYLKRLKQYQNQIDEFVRCYLKYTDKDELTTIKILEVRTLELEKFKTYIYDKYWTLEPYLGIELSEILHYYIEDELRSHEWEYISLEEEGLEEVGFI
jgi:hypothetical protein